MSEGGVAHSELAQHHVASIILVRHGQTAYNAARRMQGQIDIPLNGIGHWQADQVSQALRRSFVSGHPERQQLVVASDLSRARETARAFAEPLGVEVQLDERVRERFFGEWEGMSGQEVESRWPDDFHSWILAAGGELKHGAEPKQEVGNRGVQALEDWAHRAGSDTDLFIFSHGAWISQTLQTLLGMGTAFPEYVNMSSMRNAHWARLLPRELESGGLRWCLTDYNQGPALGYQGNWDQPDELSQEAVSQ